MFPALFAARPSALEQMGKIVGFEAIMGGPFLFGA